MSTTPNQEPLALAHALTIKTKQLCTGLETSDAEVLELVTPVTADLLRWWFGEDMMISRSLNFHAGQRQAILNTIVAHEVLGQDSKAWSLLNLYQTVAPDALLSGMPVVLSCVMPSQITRFLSQDKHLTKPSKILISCACASLCIFCLETNAGQMATKAPY